MERNNRNNRAITVGIPAHNEENNIISLLESINNQNGNFDLEEIIVACDGCTDNTVRKIQSLKKSNDRFNMIRIIDSKERLGKPARINQIFKLSNTDIAVILDGDIIFQHSRVIDNLVKPIIENQRISLTSGYAMPLEPKNFVQQIAYAGIELWDSLRQKTIKQTGLYVCEGTIRAFSRNIFSKIIFPNASADDAFSYLYCINNNFHFQYCPKAAIYYKLPENLSDYLKMLKRIAKSKKIQNKTFSPDFVASHFIINAPMRIKALFNFFPRKPLLLTLYSAMVLLSWFKVWFDGNNFEGIWEIISSTKKINE